MTPRSLLAPARLAGEPILRTQTDDRLVDLVRAGSEPAFEAIVARYRRPLLRYCGRILPDGRAEDAVQQAFVKAYDAMRTGDSHLQLRPWLYRIAHNTALNALRDRGLGHEALDESIDGLERPDQALERSQSLRAMVDAVKDLPERQRDAIVLRELEGRSYEEIAGELGVTDGAVRQLLNRARTTLRAGFTALTPVGLLLRLPMAGAEEGVAARMGELVAGAGAGAVATKVAATALVTGAVVGGAAVAPPGKEPPGRGAAEAAVERPAPPVRRAQVPSPPVPPSSPVVPAEEERSSSRRERRSGRGRGRGRGGDERRTTGNEGPSAAREESSGRGRGRGRGRGGDDDGPEDRSGSNSGSEVEVEEPEVDAEDNSGSGSSSGGSGSSGSGSGSGGHGGDDGGGSGSSGSGSSGSGSDDEED